MSGFDFDHERFEQVGTLVSAKFDRLVRQVVGYIKEMPKDVRLSGDAPS